MYPEGTLHLLLHNRIYKKPAVPKKRGSVKACEIETAISRTESKGLKEKLMLDTGIIQAVKKILLYKH